MRLIIFLTYGQSLQDWENQGILERELALYGEFQSQGHEVVFCSYGSKGDIPIARNWGFNQVLVNRWRLPTALYSFLLPYLYGDVFEKIDCFKTNQLWGAHVASRVARQFNKPFIVRQGFSYYEFVVAARGSRSISAIRTRLYEKRFLTQADGCIVTTQEMANRVTTRIDGLLGKVCVIPNYVVDSIWAPPHRPRELGRVTPTVVYAGRLSAQKNLFSLVDAVSRLNLRLVLIGDGECRIPLKERAEARGLSVRFYPRLPQRDIAARIRDCDIFVLPSLYEGHPKILIETMALGMPVVGTDSEGIRELIRNQVNGLISGTSAEDLAGALSRIITLSRQEREQLGQNARDEVLSNYAVNVIAKKELQFVQCIVSG